MTAIDALGYRLIDQIGVVDGTTLFAGSDVSVPTSLVTPFILLLHAGGPPPIGSHNAGSIRRPTFQVSARGDLFPDTESLLQQAWVAFGGDDGLVNLTMGDLFFLHIRAVSDFLTLPNDPQGRVRIAFNLKSEYRA